MELIKCAECGKEFEKTRSYRRFCCDACREKFNARKNLQRYAERKKEKKSGWKPTENERDIIEICKKAKPMRLSYGQYVAKFGGEANVRGKEVSAAGQAL